MSFVTEKVKRVFWKFVTLFDEIILPAAKDRQAG
jgi:hypothetical protein